MRVAPVINLNTDEVTLLNRLSRSRSTSVRLAERSRIILLAAEGKANDEIAETLAITRQKVGRWRTRYSQLGLAGIEKDAPRPGCKKALPESTIKKVIKLTIQSQPEGIHCQALGNRGRRGDQ